MELSALTAISPVDGRYGSKTTELRGIFSEFGLIVVALTVSNGWLSEIPIHLHYDIRQPVQIGDAVHALFLPPYSSLVAAYEKLD